MWKLRNEFCFQNTSWRDVRGVLMRIVSTTHNWEEAKDRLSHILSNLKLIATRSGRISGWRKVCLWIWENFWVKKGMSMDLVCFWRSHGWSREAVMSNEDLIRCIDGQDFLMEGHVAAVKVPRAEPRSEALLAEWLHWPCCVAWWS